MHKELSLYLLGTLILLLGLPAWSQETCRHCPNPDQMAQQFPEAPEEARPTLTKPFLIAHGAWFASIVYDSELTHAGLAHHRCVEIGGGIPERHISRGELYGENGAVFAVGTLFDWLIQRSHPPKPFNFMVYAFPTVGTIEHLHGGSTWIASCW